MLFNCAGFSSLIRGTAVMPAAAALIHRIMVVVCTNRTCCPVAVPCTAALMWRKWMVIYRVYFFSPKGALILTDLLLSSVGGKWQLQPVLTLSLWLHVCLVVPHWCPESALWEPGGDRRHSHAAGLPAPAVGGGTPPGGETEVQQCAGKQELENTRSTRQAQLHRLARRSDLNIYHCLINWRLERPFSGEECCPLWKPPPHSVFIPPPALQVLSLGHCRTSWAAGRCRGTTTTRRAASQTGAAWAPLLPNLSTKQERPRPHSWREPSPQRSRMCCNRIQKNVFSFPSDRTLQ